MSTATLNAHQRADQAAWDATTEGLYNGFLTLIPSGAAVYAALRNPTFRAATNVQARTALVIMPALFAFGWTSETRLIETVKQSGEQDKHNAKTIQWAEAQLQHRATRARELKEEFDANQHLNELYHQSVTQSGIKIVPGSQLSWYHQAANFGAEHPVKLLAALAVPSVAAIFYGRTGKEHLELSSKIMHTRVFGQFATISLLLSVMGFKEFMDRNGKFVTEAEAMARVEEMHRIRQELMERLHAEQEAQDKARRELQAAHEEVEAGRKRRKEKKNHKDSEE